MQSESPAIPHSSGQWAFTIIVLFLSYGGGLVTAWFKRKREPAEVARIHAETRQISVNTDVSLIQAATTAISKAERLQDERDHWERKATDLLLDLEDERRTNAQQSTRLTLHEHQMKRLKGLLDAHGISYSEIDKPRSSD